MAASGPLKLGLAFCNRSGYILGDMEYNDYGNTWTTTFRLDVDLRERLHAIAHTQRRSVNTTANLLLRTAIEMAEARARVAVATPT